MKKFPEDEISGLFYPKVEKRVREVIAQIPELYNLAVQISKIPKDYTEKNRTYSLSVRNLFIEKLRTNTSLFSKGKMSSEQMEYYASKALRRVNLILEKENKKDLIDAILASKLSLKDKAKIIKILDSSI